MFEQIAAPKGDPILSLITEYRNDPRSDKIDLGIGVYRNDEGITPIMKAVSAAEKLLLAQESTKAYQGLTGDELFNEALQNLLLGTTSALGRTTTLQTPGASGALRNLADLIAATKPDSTVWISNPSYINHRPIMLRAGLKVEEYPYLDPKTKLVNEAAMLAKIAELGADDILLLHGCCHNPSGADISLEAWQQIAALANKNGFLPFVDIAYQGLGNGLEEDAKGMQLLVDQVPEMIISTSCSKNFGLYRERTGAAMIVSNSIEQATNARAKMCELSRGSYSMPPAHGAAIVRTILNDAELNALWRQELDEMNQRVNGLRQALVNEFQTLSQSDRFNYFAQHKGMFSLTGLSDDMIAQLKSEFGIYIVGGGRVNIAGLKESEVTTLAQAFIHVGA
ncbi:amino acid aminotransferase [Reinekea sp. G2M2-21]|uniref:amino acid aminotransferase n=1 Tax=Reinekea sp. G2M2-21 TaxID=2788942 RepID=UPI0018AB62AD|nr:amino acid aminotransferase [Reinekea sp. G2M2-21]